MGSPQRAHVTSVLAASQEKQRWALAGGISLGREVPAWEGQIEGRLAALFIYFFMQTVINL